jgi:hypothetical protein
MPFKLPGGVPNSLKRLLEPFLINKVDDGIPGRARLGSPK